MILHGDCLAVLKNLGTETVDCAITSPPYWSLRDYGVAGQIGMEKSFHEYIAKLVAVFAEVKRVLKPKGSLWVNLGDSYMNNSSYSEKGRQGFGKDKIGMIYKDFSLCPKKSLCQIPSRFSIAMIDSGWILRNKVIWYKRNAMPSSATDRFTVDFEEVFFFTKQEKYFFNPLREARSGGAGIRNKRCVWDIPVRPFPEAHFAVYPEELVRPMIEASCPENGSVLDPFGGAGTTALAAAKMKRNWTIIELNPEYVDIADRRIEKADLTTPNPTGRKNGGEKTEKQNKGETQMSIESVLERIATALEVIAGRDLPSVRSYPSNWPEKCGPHTIFSFREHT